MSLKSWDSVKPGKLFKSQKTLLLGNGFNIALLGADGLSYSRLKNSVDDSKFSILDNIKTALSDEKNNFETLIRKLEDASSIAAYYGANARSMQDDAGILRKELARCVSELHPLQEKIIENGASRICADFLKQFGNIFTLNYDLLLYWIIMQERLETSFKDGFGRQSYPNGPLIWKGGDKQNIFYSHGALHLFEKKIENIISNVLDNSSHKVEKLENANGNIITQVNDQILSGSYPLTVVEGTHHHKTERIMENDYLRNCFVRLSKLKGSVYTYGWSASIPEDTHLIDILGISQVSKCYFGVRSLESCTQVSEAFDKVNGERLRMKKPELELVFYDVSTAPMWKQN